MQAETARALWSFLGYQNEIAPLSLQMKLDGLAVFVDAQEYKGEREFLQKILKSTEIPEAQIRVLEWEGSTPTEDLTSDESLNIVGVVSFGAKINESLATLIEEKKLVSALCPLSLSQLKSDQAAKKSFWSDLQKIKKKFQS